MSNWLPMTLKNIIQFSTINNNDAEELIKTHIATELDWTAINRQTDPILHDTIGAPAPWQYIVYCRQLSC